MNDIAPPPDGWPLLVALMLLAMLADKVYGRRFWKAVQVVGIVEKCDDFGEGQVDDDVVLIAHDGPSILGARVKIRTSWLVD